MPELPEVETIARTLREGGRGGPPLPGQIAASTAVLWERTLALPSAAEFAARMPGQEVRDVGRKGKFVVISLSRDTLLFHLRMSGDLRVETSLDSSGQGLPLAPHDRLAVTFTDNTRLVFNDTRKFGRAWLTSQPEEILGGLGPDPFDPHLTPARLHDMLQKRSRRLKPLLLDQSFLAGLGNIYTDESLHLAGLHPNRLSDQISSDEAERLYDAIRATLLEGIRHNGASIDWVYRGGTFQNSFRVYQRTGKPCPVCGHPVERIVVGQRGTHYCPICQPREV